MAERIKKTEATIQNEIILEVNKRGHRLFRGNAGTIKDERTGSWIKLLPPGFPDVFGFRESDGKFIAIEVKNAKGKLRKEQKAFADFAATQPILYGVARSVEDAIAIIEGSE